MELIAASWLPLATTVEHVPLLRGNSNPGTAVPLTGGFTLTGCEQDEAMAEAVANRRAETHK